MLKNEEANDTLVYPRLFRTCYIEEINVCFRFQKCNSETSQTLSFLFLISQVQNYTKHFILPNKKTQKSIVTINIPFFSISTCYFYKQNFFSKMCKGV